MRFYRLSYFSRSRVRGRDRLDAAVNDILAVSRVNNAAAGVTGALMVNAGYFAQVLEGERDAVEEIFDRIQHDERHCEVALLAFNQVERRMFARWSMGYVGTSTSEQERFASAAAESGFDPAFLTGHSVVRMLHLLAREEEVV